MFKPNRAFKKKYDRVFTEDPEAANLFLLLCELADEKGQVLVSDDQKLMDLLAARFNDVREYQL